MLLSIGMIVKNEEKHLRRCLNSIKPVLDAVDSELIIFDTGSTDKTIEIAKEFTDKVYEIEWRGDFSWARNQTIDKSTGKWFMYIDADEEFLDVSDMISFFNKGEYKKYKCATYRWRNILNDASAVDSSVVRLFRKGKDTRFQGRIHEFIPEEDPIKDLKSIANHYGYFNQGDEGKENMRKKHERNLPPLFEELKENPTDPRTITHLANEYRAAGNAQEYKKYLDMGMEVVGKDITKMFYHIFSYETLYYYNDMKEYSNVVKAAKEYLGTLKYPDKMPYVPQSVVPILCLYANALMSTGDYPQALTVAKDALVYFKLYEQGKLDAQITRFCPLPSFTLDNSEVHLKHVAFAYSLNGKFDEALAWAEEYRKQHNEKLGVFDIYAEEAVCRKRFGDIPRLLAYGIESGLESDNYHNVINAIEKECKDPQNKKDVAAAIANDTSLAKYDNDYVHLQRLRAYGDTPGYKEPLDYFLRSGKSFGQGHSEVIFYAMTYAEDFLPFLENSVITDTPKYIYSLINSLGFMETFVVAMQMDTRIKNSRSIKVNRIMAAIASTAYERKKATEQKEEYFELAMRLGHKLQGLMYKPEIYNAQNILSLSEQEAFTYFAGTAYACKDSGDLLGFVRGLRTAVNVYPHMKDIVWSVVNNVC